MTNNYNHFIPSKDGDLLIWNNTFKEKIGVLGAQVGLSTTQVSELETSSTTLSSALQKADIKKQEQKEAISAKELAKRKELKVITTMIAKIKADTGYTENIGNELGIVGSSTIVQKVTLRPTIKLAKYPDYVEISFIKRNQPGVSIYCRVKGSDDWKKLIGGATKSPYRDYSAVQVGQTSEVREYKARYWDNGIEMAQDSDIALTVFGN